MEVIYREGGTAILSLNEVNRSMARVKVTVNFSTDILPFATFRSMYVSDGNADVDHVRWQDFNGVIHDEQIMAFQGGEGSALLFYRSNWSKHNPSGPDIAIKNFIAPTPTPTPTPATCQGDINGDGAINSSDFVLFAIAYNSASGDAAYNIKADMNNNGVVNSDDFVLFAVKYGTSCVV